MEYLIPVFLSIVGIIFNNRFSSSARRIFLIIILLYIIFLIGFRYRVGVDTLSYMQLFKDAPSLKEVFSWKVLDRKHEPGYLLVCALCKLISKEFWPVQIVMTTITSTCIFIFIYRYCKNVFLGVLIFFILQWLYFSTEIIRESAAIGIFLVNFKNLQDKKWLKYYFFCIFSLSFHYSSIIIFFFPFVKYLKFNLYFIIGCGSILAITPLVDNLNQFLELGVITDKVNTYIEQADKNNLNWKIAELLKTSFPAILTVFLFYRSKIKNTFQPYVLLQILLCCGTFAIPQIFQRFTNYTSLFVTVSFANIIILSYYKTPLKICMVGILCLSQSVYYYTMRPAWDPYISVFNPKTIQQREKFYRKIF